MIRNGCCYIQSFRNAWTYLAYFTNQAVKTELILLPSMLMFFLPNPHLRLWLGLAPRFPCRRDGLQARASSFRRRKRGKRQGDCGFVIQNLEHTKDEDTATCARRVHSFNGRASRPRRFTAPMPLPVQY